MNNIDMILQSADLPEPPVEAISDERQAKILSGALQLARQDAKKRSRRRVVRIAAAAAAAVAVLCGAAAILHYASVSNEEGTYHAEGVVILYADKITPSMSAAMEETSRRRELQNAYNEAHGIVPKTIVKSVRDIIEISHAADGKDGKRKQKLSAKEKAALIANLEKEMKEASRRLEFEYAAVLRDQIIELRGKETAD